MAARVLLQRVSFHSSGSIESQSSFLKPIELISSFQRALAAAALGGMALTPATAFAEAPAVDKESALEGIRGAPRFVANASVYSQRKPIYDDFEAALPAPPSTPKSAPLTADPKRETGRTRDDDELPVIVKPRGPTPTDQLAVQIGKARLALYRTAVVAEDKVNEAMDRAFGLEQSFTKTLASLAPSRESGEKLMPGAIYVLVAAMAGSIVARNRNVLLRATLPIAFGVGAGWAVLPVTMRNIADLAWTYEQRVPAVRDAHLQIREGLEKTASFARVHARLGVRLVDEKVTDAREIVEGWVRQGK
ncbi:hypothetical protein MY5147_004780 [Beauveria neobassiana]